MRLKEIMPRARGLGWRARAGAWRALRWGASERGLMARAEAWRAAARVSEAGARVALSKVLSRGVWGATMISILLIGCVTVAKALGALDSLPQWMARGPLSPAGLALGKAIWIVLALVTGMGAVVSGALALGAALRAGGEVSAQKARQSEGLARVAREALELEAEAGRGRKKRGGSARRL